MNKVEYQIIKYKRTFEEIIENTWKEAQREMLKELKPLIEDKCVKELFVNKLLIQKYYELVKKCKED